MDIQEQSRVHLARDGVITSHNYVRRGFNRMFVGAYGRIGQRPEMSEWDVHRSIALCRAHAAMEAFAHKGAVLYGSTALMALGVALPLRLFDWQNCHILLPLGVNPPHRKGVVVHRTREMPVERWPVGSLPTVHPVDHWLQMRNATDDEMIEIGDGLMRRKNPLLTLDSVHLRLDELTGVHGVKRARRLLPWVMPNTESLPETTTRLLLVHGGLPMPQVNLEAFCPLVNRTYHLDTGYDKEKVGVEYDGAVHVGDRVQMEIDANRRRHLQDAGWIIITVTADQLRSPQAVVRSVENALMLRRQA